MGRSWKSTSLRPFLRSNLSFVVSISTCSLFILAHFIYPIHIHDSHDPRKFLAITRGLPVYRIKQYHDPVCASLLVCLILILQQPESESESVPLLPSSCMDITFYLRHFSPVLRDLQSQARHHIAPAAQIRVVAQAPHTTRALSCGVRR